MLSNTLAGLMALALAAPTQAPIPEPPRSMDFGAIRRIAVQHDGRWPPLDTVARDLVEQITGTESYRGRDPVAVLLAWTFDPATWRGVPLIAIRNAELRRELQLPETRTEFSHAELIAHQHLRALVDGVSRLPKGQKLNPLEAKVSDIHEKLLTLQGVFLGRSLALIPDPKDALAAWQTIPSVEGKEPGANDAVVNAWSEVRSPFLADDGPAFTSASQRLASALASLPAAYRPAESRIATELHYNQLAPFRTAWMIMVLGTALSLLAVAVRRRWFDALAVLGMVAGFTVLTYGLALRWQIAGRIPASNMFESLLFLSWGMGAFAILSMLVIRHRIVPLTASFMGAVALVLADLLPMDHFIRPIPPVLLDTVWMSIHVPVIMVSYSVLALGVLIAHVQLVVMAAVPGRQQLARTIDSLHYWYIHVGSILLLAGIVTGSMWAASSWGRYWGWDPKEVWSLVALLGYLAILHVRIDQEKVPAWAYAVALILTAGVFALIVPTLAPLTPGKLAALCGAALAMLVFVLGRGPFATALKSVLAFWLIIMTYVGVNYVLGIGLHSYGFGTGAVVRYMFRTGGIDLGVIALCTGIYVLRRQRSTITVTAQVPQPGLYTA